MFGVIYQWRILPGHEAAFEQAWAEGTRAIRDEFGGWGSRLHRIADGVYFAYAQWPDEQTWRAASNLRMAHSKREAARIYREAIAPDGFEVLFAGAVVGDELDLRRA